MVIAKRGEIDRIADLKVGAGDYVPKPLNPHGELLAHIRSRATGLRRHANELLFALLQEEAIIAFDKFKLNISTREMFRTDGPMLLQSSEFSLLKALVSHPRKPLVLL